MEKILRVFRLWRRPVIVLPIFIRAHQKELHGLASREFVLNALALKVVPIQDDLEIRILESVYAKVDVSNSTPEARVAADLHQQMLLRARCFRGSMCLATHVVPKSAGA